MGVNPAVFYTCLWECLTSNAAVRLPAISFILSHFDRHLTMKDQMYLMGNDVDLMVSVMKFATSCSHANIYRHVYYR